MMNEEKSYTTEDLLLFIDKLRRENQQLKEKVGELTQSLNEQMKLTNEENLDCSKYAVENKQLKEVIEEVRERVVELKKRFKQEEHQGTAYDDDLEYDELLQILDKVKENK